MRAKIIVNVMVRDFLKVKSITVRGTESSGQEHNNNHTTNTENLENPDIEIIPSLGHRPS